MAKGTELSAREREVLALLSEHMTNSEIAQRLVISEGTVAVHVKHILRKLGVPNRRAAARIWSARENQSRPE